MWKSPYDSPTSVTLLGSPPNALILLWIQCSASRWSNIPKLSNPSSDISFPFKNPNGPNL